MTSKVQQIKALRNLFPGLGLFEAKILVENINSLCHARHVALAKVTGAAYNLLKEISSYARAADVGSGFQPLVETNIIEAADKLYDILQSQERGNHDGKILLHSESHRR